MFKKSLMALALSGAAISAQAGIVVQEGFNNVAALPGQGWVLANSSTPAGAIGNWFQGDQQQFPAAEGPAESYIAGAYGMADAGGMLDAWIITPEYTTGNTVKVTFMMRSGDTQGAFLDYLAFGISNGSSFVSDFAMASEVAVPQDGWQLVTLRYDATITGTSGRFAIHYTGPADNANYVGIDSLTVTVPEPSTALVLAAGLLGLGAVRRKRA